jgi:hypothetical protein
MARAGDLTFEPRIGNTLSAPTAHFTMTAQTYRMTV